MVTMCSINKPNNDEYKCFLKVILVNYNYGHSLQCVMFVLKFKTEPKNSPSALYNPKNVSLG